MAAARARKEGERRIVKGSRLRGVSKSWIVNSVYKKRERRAQLEREEDGWKRERDDGGTLTEGPWFIYLDIEDSGHLDERRHQLPITDTSEDGHMKEGEWKTSGGVVGMDMDAKAE